MTTVEVVLSPKQILAVYTFGRAINKPTLASTAHKGLLAYCVGAILLSKMSALEGGVACSERNLLQFESVDTILCGVDKREKAQDQGSDGSEYHCGGKRMARGSQQRDVGNPTTAIPGHTTVTSQ